jgi:hypothetical protein
MDNIIRSCGWATCPRTGHPIPALARVSGRNTGVGYGTVPPEPRSGMAGYGVCGAIRFPTRPKACSGPERRPAGQAQMLTLGHTQLAQHTAKGAMVRCDTHNLTHRVMPMGRRGGTS